MTLGLSLEAFTQLHVALSLVGIASGLVVVAGMLASQRLPVPTAVFLATTVLTSVTGFMFPFNGFQPSHAFGVISLAVLAVAIAGLCVFRFAGPWRWLYVAGAFTALYLNVFEIGALNALAPTQSEAPFAAAQGAVLVLFAALGAAAVRRFRPRLPAPIASRTVRIT